jgi:hypothetical protein
MQYFEPEATLSEMITDLEEIQRHYRKDCADKAALMEVVQAFLDAGRVPIMRPLYELAEKTVQRAKEPPDPLHS